MDPITGGALITAGATLLSGYLGQDAQESANDANMAINQQNIDLQREFAKEGIRWKVEDAKAAGIHPVAALGAGGAAFSPSGITIGAEDGMAQAIGRMGQDVGRAVSSTRTEAEKAQAALSLATQKTHLESMEIENQIKKTQLRNLQLGSPSFPSAGGGGPLNGNAVVVKPSEVIATQSPGSGVQAGMIPTLQYHRETSGNIGISPSEQMKERNEDDIIGETLWHMKNRAIPPAPSVQDYPIPEHLRKKGYNQWKWNVFTQEFVPSRGNLFHSMPW